jgi:DNA polymerase III delta prime subunit
MKFLETHFEEYINVKDNLHPKLEKIFNKFPKKLIDLKNLIFYGPNGVGKYTQVLKSIRKYSPSDLKYEKKISVTYNKQQFYFKISDIHYEVDMSLLGCNSKLLWHEIYSQIIDIVSAKTEKSGIIVCKCFNDIHSELLENFYSYMQKNNALSIDLKFILVTEELSFIPDNILNCCEVINIARPSKAMYAKCLKNKLLNTKVESITNIKNIHCSITELMMPHKIICDKILDAMIKIEETKFLKFRDLLYDIFIYNLGKNYY